MSKCTKRNLRAATLLGLLVSLAGCGVSVDPADNDNDSGNDPPPAPTRFTIRVINNTDTTLDPEIFISATGTDALDESKKFTRFGVGTIGILAASTADVFTVECEDAARISTAGGSFGDDIHNPDGRGRRIILSRDINVFCGQTITFAFRRGQDGMFTTSFSAVD